MLNWVCASAASHIITEIPMKPNPDQTAGVVRIFFEKFRYDLKLFKSGISSLFTLILNKMCPEVPNILAAKINNITFIMVMFTLPAVACFATPGEYLIL